MGAEKLIAAEREGQKIAVEIKSFISKSPIKDLENALGQYILYVKLLSRLDPERLLYLAVQQEVYINFFSEEIVQIILDDGLIKLCIMRLWIMISAIQSFFSSLAAIQIQEYTAITTTLIVVINLTKLIYDLNKDRTKVAISIK